MDSKIMGQDHSRQKLKYIQENARQIRGKIKLSELFSPSFMRSHTKLADIQEFFDNSGFRIATKADMRAVPDEIWNKYTASVSEFSSWKEMFCAATAEYMKEKLKA